MTLNILVKHGVDADLNGDGVMSPDEWQALDDVVRSRAEAHKNSNQRSRLINMLLH